MPSHPYRGKMPNIAPDAWVAPSADLIGDVTLGHGAIVHSSIVGDNVLIGMGAVLVGGNRIGDGTIVGAGAVLPAGMEVPPRKLVVGVPAKVVRDAVPADERWTVDAARHYVELSREYRER